MLPDSNIPAAVPPQEPHYWYCLHTAALIRPTKAPENCQILLLNQVRCHSLSLTGAASLHWLCPCLLFLLLLLLLLLLLQGNPLAAVSARLQEAFCARAPPLSLLSNRPPASVLGTNSARFRGLSRVLVPAPLIMRTVSSPAAARNAHQNSSPTVWCSYLRRLSSWYVLQFIPAVLTPRVQNSDYVPDSQGKHAQPAAHQKGSGAPSLEAQTVQLSGASTKSRLAPGATCPARAISLSNHRPAEALRGWVTGALKHVSSRAEARA